MQRFIRCGVRKVLVHGLDEKLGIVEKFVLQGVFEN